MCDGVQPGVSLNGTLERKPKPRGLQEQNTCAPGKGGGILRPEKNPAQMGLQWSMTDLLGREAPAL